MPKYRREVFDNYKKLKAGVKHTRQKAYEYQAEFKQSDINLSKKYIVKSYAARIK